ncbi:SDR family NAD(P)-dependent oxidoreductase [Halorubellus sp. JP-L1]|uniref:SDR family NAD(P)-dependent oxidoreductase n=1 Tax=Halorubellus sp. JP-L1 TaxID=2715753 RepID=UPI00140BA05D|nr:SDR family NAD(P)-dependent oxidoreductase [Halorubellus sp. JP-L1]NHN40807.1 SDR family NAD(P)-dependent oxidoreductase [Halorubellus sp. JP-L1]
MEAATTGRVVVLTGANEGIGRGMLATLLEDGYRVAALDVDTSNLDAFADQYGQQLRVYECDVTSDEDVESSVADVMDAWGRIDVLVNNAAIFEFGLVRDRSLSDTREEFEVNVFGPLRLVHAVLPHMRERGEGKIHFVSSGVGRVGNPGLTGYGATKGALEAYARSLRLELQLESVTCTVMHPALARTRSAVELGYPESTMDDPADVGRKLARKLESTKPVVYADWKTRIGLAVAERFPGLVKRGTRRFLDAPPTPDGATSGAGSESRTAEDESATSALHPDDESAT